VKEVTVCLLILEHAQHPEYVIFARQQRLAILKGKRGGQHTDDLLCDGSLKYRNLADGLNDFVHVRLLQSGKRLSVIPDVPVAHKFLRVSRIALHLPKEIVKLVKLEVLIFLLEIYRIARGIGNKVQLLDRQPAFRIIVQHAAEFLQFFNDGINAAAELDESPLHVNYVNTAVACAKVVDTTDLACNLREDFSSVVAEVVHQSQKIVHIDFLEPSVHHIERGALLTHNEHLSS